MKRIIARIWLWSLGAAAIAIIATGIVLMLVAAYNGDVAARAVICFIVGCAGLTLACMFSDWALNHYND